MRQTLSARSRLNPGWLLLLSILVWVLSTAIAIEDDGTVIERKDPITGDVIEEKQFKSQPVATVADLPKSKFTERTALTEDQILFPNDASGLLKNSKCPMRIELVWTNKLDTGVYATPSIEPLLSDGLKQIVIGGFKRDLELLDSDGHRLPEWPFQVDDIYFHASPILVDTRKLGFQDFVWVSVNGEIYIISGDPSSSGLLLQDPFFIPKLRIKKFWYKGLEYNADTKMNPGADTVPSGQQAKAGTDAGARRLLSFEDDPDNDNFDPDTIPATPLAPAPATPPAWTDQVGDGLSDEGKDSLNLFTSENEIDDFGSVDHFHDGKFDPSFVEEHEKNPKEAEWIYVDPHVMATPVAADINGDGYPELIVSVSYFFDEDDYANNPSMMRKLDPDVNIKKYVAGGVIVFDIRKQEIIWSEQLDLTTDETDLRAFVYSSPTVIDLDGDGHLEIIVGTSLGFIYAMEASTGKTLPGFPIVMSEVQAQIAVADVNSDGKLELVAVDNKGNVLCFDRSGKEIWDSRISGFAAQGATFGDVDGNGVLDVVLGTVNGHIWALRGDNGKPLAAFPVKTNGKILAPVLLVNLDSDLSSKGLHLVVASFDGYIYIVDGRTGCTNKVDLGEKAYAMVLTDDILGHEKMDLLLATMSGTVYCFSTESPYHPLKAWTSQTQRMNGFTARHNYQGIYVLPETRQMHNVLGSSMSVSFEIVDNRPTKAQKDRRYDVSFSLEGAVWFSKTYTTPGIKIEEIPVPKFPIHATYHVEMYNEHHQYFSDSFSVGFNVHYYRALKWLVLIPFLGLTTVLVVVKTLKPELPL